MRTEDYRLYAKVFNDLLTEETESGSRDTTAKIQQTHEEIEQLLRDLLLIFKASL